MVTGQALVLYSRLHLVVADVRKVRWVLWMIHYERLHPTYSNDCLVFGLNNGNAHLLALPRSSTESN